MAPPILIVANVACIIIGLNILVKRRKAKVQIKTGHGLFCKVVMGISGFSCAVFFWWAVVWEMAVWQKSLAEAFNASWHNFVGLGVSLLIFVFAYAKLPKAQTVAKPRECEIQEVKVEKPVEAKKGEVDSFLELAEKLEAFFEQQHEQSKIALPSASDFVGDDQNE